MSTREIWSSDAARSPCATGAGAAAVTSMRSGAALSCSSRLATCAWEAESCCSAVFRRPLRSAIFWSMASTSEEICSRKASTSSVS